MFCTVYPLRSLGTSLNRDVVLTRAMQGWVYVKPKQGVGGDNQAFVLSERDNPATIVATMRYVSLTKLLPTGFRLLGQEKSGYWRGASTEDLKAQEWWCVPMLESTPATKEVHGTATATE
jgi:hypothetical protein